MIRIFCTLLFITVVMNSFGQRTITFPSKDGLTVTADLYANRPEDPWIVLCHQANFSRGEYIETAKRLHKIGYNCLAIDQRSGKECNYIKNATAIEALQKGLPTGYLDARPDMEAAVDYAYEKSKRLVILFGSSYSASLALVMAAQNPKIKAVVAFSPGEYFGNDLQVEPSLKRLSVPAYVTSSAKEFLYVKRLMAQADPAYVTLFDPGKIAGTHGSKVLWPGNKDGDEYWLSLLLFFSKIK